MNNCVIKVSLMMRNELRVMMSSDDEDVMNKRQRSNAVEEERERQAG
jgi:hypothetical protein